MKGRRKERGKGRIIGKVDSATFCGPWKSKKSDGDLNRSRVGPSLHGSSIVPSARYTRFTLWDQGREGEAEVEDFSTKRCERRLVPLVWRYARHSKLTKTGIILSLSLSLSYSSCFLSSLFRFNGVYASEEYRPRFGERKRGLGEKKDGGPLCQLVTRVEEIRERKRTKDPSGWREELRSFLFAPGSLSSSPLLLEAFLFFLLPFYLFFFSSLFFSFFSFFFRSPLLPLERKGAKLLYVQCFYVRSFCLISFSDTIRVWIIDSRLGSTKEGFLMKRNEKVAWNL